MDAFYLLFYIKGTERKIGMKKTVGSIIKWILIGLTAAVIIAAAAVWPHIENGYQMYRTAVEQNSISEKAAEIRSSDSYISLEELPDEYIRDLVHSEDKRFYYHLGIDPIAIVRAAWNDILAGSFVQGGSTITQQLAKNMYYSFDKNIDRKIAEVFTAADLERELTKDEILELYVNDIYFGNNQYGIRNASIYYYGVEPVDLSSEQIDQLVFTIKCPNDFNPNAVSDQPQLLTAE